MRKAGAVTAVAMERMLRRVAKAVSDERVLAAMRAVPREEFVPSDQRRNAYEDAALPIGAGQTISQPLIVGMMSEALELQGGERVLEIGTGSGYQAAILAELAAEVVTVELIDTLRQRAQAALAHLGVSSVLCLPAGPSLGAPEHAPFDAAIVTAAAPDVPGALLEQLGECGRIVIPVGSREQQELTVVTKTAGGARRRAPTPCRFVPLVGPGGFPPAKRRGWRWPGRPDGPGPRAG